ncbi:S8 family serine peptidase [Terrisporobacter petrolearius]|uniref:S8 family serine peptidase n=1 Tax=Terrisporobacter petrolearius TaxID=1460447 RepID=UPI001D1645AC|nr:S8 family peptidase [Terrisporobacter petrolearius]MCC3865994.1 S8 family serine peptidase [Terrisporobacter petrolearius]
MINIKKISINFDDDSNKTIYFQVPQEERKVDIHIYADFNEDFQVCIINPNNKRSKFISNDMPIIKNKIDNVKIKGETYIFNGNSYHKKIRITLVANDEKENICEGIWKLLFIPKDEVRGTINVYTSFSSSFYDLKKLMKLNRQLPSYFNTTNNYVILYKPGFEEDLKEIAPDYDFLKISDDLGVLSAYVNHQNINSVETLRNALSINSIDRILSLVSPNSLSIITQGTTNGVNANEEIGVNFLKNNPNISLSGKGVLIGLIDTGIDYLHPDFIYDDNTTKVVSLWDQSKDGKPPQGFYIGSEYTKDDINNAILNNDNSLSIDDEGSGTMLAGICAGMGKVNKNYVGVAEGAELIIVKMGKFNGDYNNAMVTAGFEYIKQKAREFQRPVVVNFGFGNNSLAGVSERNLSDLTFYEKGVSLVNAAGNEGNTDTHNSGRLLFKNDVKTIELEVNNFEENINIDIWLNKPDIARVAVLSPSGELTRDVDVSIYNTVVGILDLEGTIYSITYIFPTLFSGQQQVIIKLTNVPKGIWKIILTGQYIIDGEYNAYLSNRAILKPGTKFTNSDPNKTINYPATYNDNITVGAYNTIGNSIWPSSSRGNTISNILKPDIVAPGVNIIAPYPGGGYATVTGTAPAAAYTSGCITYLLQHNFVNENYPRLGFVQEIRTYLRAGATRLDNISYPNNNLGYGFLNIRGSFYQLR